MNPIDRLPPRISLYRRDVQADGAIKSHVRVEPAVGEPYELLCTVDPIARRIDMWPLSGQPELTDSQRDHCGLWFDALAKKIEEYPAGWTNNGGEHHEPL